MISQVKLQAVELVYPSCWEKSSSNDGIEEETPKNKKKSFPHSGLIRRMLHCFGLLPIVELMHSRVNSRLVSDLEF